MEDQVSKFWNIFGRFVLKDSFRYKDLFQIYPPENLEINSENIFNDKNAMILEYKYNPEPFSTKSGKELWFVDIFENNRHKEYSEKKIDQINSSKETDQIFFDCVKQIRATNIIGEIITILNLLLSHHIWYDYTGIIPSQIDKFKTIEIGNKDRISHNMYYKSNYIARDAIDLNDDKEKNTLFLPESLEYFLDRYFSLNKERKRQFFSAAHYFYQAERAFNLSPGIRYLLFACVIGALTPNEKKYGAKKRFKEYIREFSGVKSWNIDGIDFLEALWNIRNYPAHGEIVRYDLIRHCDFYVGESDYIPKEKELRWIAQRICLNWLSATDEKIDEINNTITKSKKSGE